MTMAPPPVPRTSRPTGAGVIGMLYMIFGGLGVLGALIGVAVVPLMNRIAAEIAETDPLLENYLEAFSEPIFPLILAMGLVQSGVVTVGGFGLWTMRPWGRRVAEIATWIWLATTLLSTIISYGWVREIISASMELEDEPVPAGFESMMNAITLGSIVFNVILYGGLLGWAIVYLRKPKVKAAYGE